ncbi:MAG: hypothetical protein HZB41_02275 [Ignavibacteriae bacterium]|nr:hypothetical protein [Ignavibacteriota bacterium]
MKYYPVCFGMKFNVFRIIVIPFMFFLFINQLKSQDSTLFITDSIPIKSIYFNSSKLENTFILNNTANFEVGLFEGKLIFEQKYNGSSRKIPKTIHVKINDTESKDSSYTIIENSDLEDYELKFLFPVWNSLNFIINHNLNYYSFSGEIGINKMEKLNGSAGFRYLFNNESFIEFSGGLEKNNVATLSYSGKLFNIEGYLTDIYIEDYLIQTKLKGNYSDLTKNRKNMNIDLKYLMNKKFDSEDDIDFEMYYKLSYIDYLPSIKTGNSDFNEIETRTENIIGSLLNINFALSNSLFGLLNLTIEKSWYEKFYKTYYVEYNYTGISKSLNKFNLSFLAEEKYKTSDFVQIAGLYFQLQSKVSEVANTRNINDYEYNILKKEEAMFDEDVNTTKLYFQTIWMPNNNEILKLDYSVSLTQNNTPSIFEYSDRDEYNSFVNLTFQHKFNDNLRFSLGSYIQLKHLVYIKSQSSANNNWERDISFKPGINWNTNYFKMNPGFELLVKYISYDFESDTIPYPRSSSNRIIKYQDSITIKFWKSLSLQINVNLIYYEIGVFYWNDFSETPTTSNFEKYIKAMLLTSYMNNSVNIGLGVKYYNTINKSLLKFSENDNSLENKYISIGPAVDLSFNFPSGSYITLQGCYEFQNVNYTIYKLIPIFHLNTKIVL